MLKKHPFLALIFLLSLSHLSLAKSPLTLHAISVSQSMSAFYMYNLSEGQSRYKTDYESFLKSADQYLDEYQKEDSVAASEFKQQWVRLRGDLNYDTFEGSEYFVPGRTRIQFRSYLNKLYKKIVGSINSESNLPQQLALMELSVEVISARFFDISSSLYGVQSLTSEDLQIDPVKISKQFKEKLIKFQKIMTAKAIKRDLSSVQGKWAFIEDTVINYKEQSAYLLVYYNKRKINTLLNKSQSTLLAGS